jgi:hypothetical protein
MSQNQKPDIKEGNASHKPATLWEHLVLQKASEKQVMMFDLEIEDKQLKIGVGHNKRKMWDLDAATTATMADHQRTVSAPVRINTVDADSKEQKKSDLDAATTATMNDRQRCVSAPIRINTTPDTYPTNSVTTEPEAEPQASLLARLESAFSSDSHTTTEPESVPDSRYRIITFGPNQANALSPETLHDDAERQAALVKMRPTGGLTVKRITLKASVREDELVMSGALDLGDVRCEVCAARERAMFGLEEAGIVAL